MEPHLHMAGKNWEDNGFFGACLRPCSMFALMEIHPALISIPNERKHTIQDALCKVNHFCIFLVCGTT